MTELLGATMLSGKYLARLLREEKRGLWPEIGQGRRGGVGLRDLIYFWMAYALCGGRPSPPIGFGQRNQAKLSFLFCPRQDTVARLDQSVRSTTG